MRLLAAVLWLAVSATGEPRRVVLLEELVRVEALRSRSYELPLPQQKAALELHWSVKEPAGAVRLLVLEQGATGAVFDSGYQTEGQQRVRLAQASNYQVLVENRQQRLGHALVDLRLELLFGEERRESSQTVGPSPERRFWAMAGSWALFAMMVAFAGVRLGPAIWQRWGR